MSIRAFAAATLLTALVACAPRQPAVKSAASDCFSQFSSHRYEYTLLGSGNPYLNAMLEADRRSRDKSDFPDVIATSTYGFKLVVTPKNPTVRPSVTWEEAKAKADMWNRKLDEIDAQIEAGKAQMGECFGQGYYGEQGAKKYADSKNSVAKTRERMREYLNAAKSISEEAQEIDRWRISNARYLKHRVGNMELEIAKLAKRTLYSSTRTEVIIAATNVTSSTILKPCNYRVWGYDVHPDLGGSTPIGTSMSDSFGNVYKLTKVSPKYLGNEARGIRPAQTEIFELDFGDMPLESTKFIRISIEPGAYGQSKGTTFQIPANVYFQGITQH